MVENDIISSIHRREDLLGSVAGSNSAVNTSSVFPQVESFFIESTAKQSRLHKPVSEEGGQLCDAHKCTRMHHSQSTLELNVCTDF